MRRSEALIELSREHHTALSLAQRARLVAANGDTAALEGMAAKMRIRFESELNPHFEEEERWLFPALAAAGETALVERGLAEHAELRQLVEQLADGGAEALQAFADGLTQHIRFEERELFTAAEKHPVHLRRYAESDGFS